MSNIQDPWNFIKQQRQRLILILSLISLGSGVVTSLLNKTNPPIISLSIFSVLLFGILIWMIFAHVLVEKLVLNEKDDRRISHVHKRKYSIRQILGAWIGGLLILITAWSFIYREHILYSTFVDRIYCGPRVLVSDAVAWQVLKYSTPAGEKSNTVSGELASLLSGLPYRIVVIKQEDLSGFKAAKRDGLIVDGVVERLGVVLKVQMIINLPRMERLIEQLQKKVEIGQEQDRGGAVITALPAKRFLRNQFLSSQFMIEAPLPPDTSAEYRITVARLVLRHALATMLFYDGNPEAANLFRENVSIGKLLTSIESISLASIYKTTGYYLAVYGQQTDLAVEALELAHSFAPSDTEVDVMMAYLLLASGRPEKAEKLVKQLRPTPDDPALVHELRGEYFMEVEKYKDAIQSYKAALLKEQDEGYRSFLHFAIALCYGATDHAATQVRSAEMIKHIEDAIQVQKDIEGTDFSRPKESVLYILQGFAWALQGDGEMSREAFNTSASLVETSEEEELLAYWFGKSLFELKKYPQAIEELQTLVGDLQESEDASLLLIFAQNLINIPEKAADAEKYLDRAIQLEPDLADAYRLKGIAVAERMLKTPATEVDRRGQLIKESRSYLLKSIRLGDERITTHNLLSTLYEETGDPVNAEKHRNRACELNPNATNCLIYRARQLVESGDISAAHDVFARVHQVNPTDANTRLEEGIIWQMAGRNVEAEKAYAEALKLDQNSYTGHDNLAFVLFDLGRFEDAISHFDSALKLSPNEPDALAGKAIALEMAGKHVAAISTYKLAVDHDTRFLNCQILQDEFLWSKAACTAAQPLIEELRRSRHF